MNIRLLSITAVALILGLTACNKEEVQNPESIPTNAVRITASVGNPFVTTRSNPVGDVTAQAAFNVGDRISVNDDRDTAAVYKFDGTKWAATSTYWDATLTKHMLWYKNNITFEAHYPINTERNGIIWRVEEDQSTIENITLSDLMYAKIENASKGDVLNFVMERQTSRIILKIAGFNAEFPSDSKVSDVNIVYHFNPYPYTPLDSVYVNYTPFEQGSGFVNSSYTLLADERMMEYRYHINLKVGDKQMNTPILRSGTKGKSYTLNLLVGKEKLEIESVTVEDWTNTVTIPGGQAGELD